MRYGAPHATRRIALLNSPSTRNGSRAIEFALVGVVCLLMFLFRLSAFGLVGADEPRYAEVAREMLARHDWVTPFLYGQPWLEKPIGYYWGAMVSYKLLGVSDWAARLPNAVLASMMVLFVYGFFKRFRPRIAVDSALMVATSVLIFGMGRAASTDMTLSAPFAIAMLCWFGWYETESKGWLAGSHAALGVAMLAKGPIAPFLAVVIVVAFSLLRREPSRIWRTLWAPGLLVFCAVALPWYVLVQMRTPEFFRIFILEHNLGRFGSNMFRHKQPFWYYVPVVLLAVAPWTIWFVTALARGVRDWRLLRSERSNALTAFLLVWLVVPIAFFSVSQSKLPGYILPAIPPCLLLAAEYIHGRAERGERLPIWAAALQALLMAVLVAALLFAPSRMLHVAHTQQALMFAAVAAALTFGLIFAGLSTRGWPMLRMATLVPMVLMIGFVLRVLGPTVDATQSARPIAQLLQRLGVDDRDRREIMTFHAKRDLPYGLTFYLRRNVGAYEGLEISPNHFDLPPRVPLAAHIVVAREGSREELQELLSGREMLPIGYYRPQKLEIFAVSAAR